MTQPSSLPTQATRRDVLKATGASALALLAPSAYAWGPGDERLNVALIGVGGRGRANTNGVRGERIVALCDTSPDALAAAAENYPDATQGSDWREVVGREDVDAVVVSTADHHHALVSLAAMRAGKHVYCEKPLGHTVAEARLMQDVYLANRGRIVTQMGTQIHAGGNYRRVVELIQSGAIGPVREAHVWCSRTITPVDEATLPAQPVPEGFAWDVWLGPAADRAYNDGYWRGGNLNWNRRWDFGNGVLGDMGSHLIDLPFWALALRDATSVECEGPEPDAVAAPPWMQATWEHPARASEHDALAVPCRVVWYHGPDGMRRRSEHLQPMVGEVTNLRQWGIGVAFVGDDGVLVTDYGKHVLAKDGQALEVQPPEAWIPDSLGHHREWLEAIKTGGETLCNFDYSGKLIEHNLLGNVAHRAGRRLQWNAQAGTVDGDEAAQALLTKDYREGWGLT